MKSKQGYHIPQKPQCHKKENCELLAPTILSVPTFTNAHVQSPLCGLNVRLVVKMCMQTVFCMYVQTPAELLTDRELAGSQEFLDIARCGFAASHPRCWLSWNRGCWEACRRTAACQACKLCRQKSVEFHSSHHPVGEDVTLLWGQLCLTASPCGRRTDQPQWRWTRLC